MVKRGKCLVKTPLSPTFSHLLTHFGTLYFSKTLFFVGFWRIISFWTYIHPLLGWGLMGHKKTHSYE